MAALLPVADAIARIAAGLAPVGAESLDVAAAAGRVLSEPLTAKRTQPPFDASAMDGYAVRAADVTAAGARLTIIGASAAGRRFAGTIGPGEAIRIYTGAPLPVGADAILIQESATVDGATLSAKAAVVAGRHVRRAGYDFREGDVALAAGRRLGMREVALAAALGYGTVAVRRRPRVAILATGDELVPPGAAPGPDQIVATNALAVSAHVRSLGGEAADLGIVGDSLDAIAAALDKAMAGDPDVIVTIGGVSVGDHDLVRPALAARGVTLDFWRIAMRPGRPMMFGHLPAADRGEVRVLGLPGNPASAIVCTIVFLTPLIAALQGQAQPAAPEAAELSGTLPENDDRQDYLRARLTPRPNALPLVTPLPVQNSGMLTTLSAADCLLVRPPGAPAAKSGDICGILRLP